MYYYLSLGTNIEPEKNAANMIKMLAASFGPCVIYPFLYTLPENIATKNKFLNSVAIIFSTLDSADVKQRLNVIEITLGRDRQDPDRSAKDRTADIDILDQTPELNEHFFSQFEETYIGGVVQDNAPGVDLSTLGLPTTKGATTVDFDATTGNIRVLENTGDRLKYWHKPTFMI